MFIQYLRHTCLFFLLLSFNSASFSDVYKWVDDEGNTHYSQQAPKNQDAKIIKAPPPPARSAADAQQEIDTLIEKQSGTFEAKQEERRANKEAAKEQAETEKFCQANRHNLQQYKDNPNRRSLDADGNVTRQTEEERQAKIAEIQQRLDEHCQGL